MTVIADDKSGRSASNKTGPSGWRFNILACTELSSGSATPLLDMALMALLSHLSLAQCRALVVDTDGALEVAE